jgi:hypothetical protein
MSNIQNRFRPTNPSLENGIIPLPLEQAANTLWTVRQGPSTGRTDTMAKLYEDGDMDIEDFAWIILRWDKPDIKRAAYTLLIDKLKQPQLEQAVLRHGPTVLGGSTYLEEQQYESMYFGLFSALWGIVFGVALTVAIVWAAISKILEGYPWTLMLTASLIVTVILVVPLALYSRYDFKKEMAKSRNFRLGREGEQWVADRVSAKLDSQWTVFRNLRLPGRKSNCDLVLVGPPGVYVLEVKAYRHTVRVNNGTWEEQQGSGWRVLSQNPQAQATSGALDVKDWLNRHNVLLPYVDKAVVLTQPQASTDFATAKAPVWLHYDIDNQISNLESAPAKLLPEVTERAVTALKEAASGKFDR